ncbi:MAG: arginine deiminase-related protein [Lysobacterales bacterium]
MLTSDPAQFLLAAANAAADFSSATAKAVMLVTDRGFSVATETAADNHYLDLDDPASADEAWRQQCALAQLLRDLGLATVQFSPLDGAGDSIFPNNSFATGQQKLITGSMRYPGRQRETQHPGIRRFFADTLGYPTVDLAPGPGTAELTGALVIDHARQLGFCGLSERADPEGAAAMHEAFGLRATFTFALPSSEYHTNVVLSVLAGKGVVSFAPQPHYAGLRQVLDGLYGDGVCYIGEAEKNQFVANCLAVTPQAVVMSDRARRAMSASTLDFFQRSGFNVHSVDVSELEKAGGSVRCMIAEIF